MKTMKNGLKLAVVAALAIPVAAQAALQYTPPQAMVLTCNGSAPNVLNKTSALATFACANGQVPQAVGVTSGLGDLLGLASGASILAASEAVPHMALPGGASAPASGSPASGNGTNAGKGSNSSNASDTGNGSGKGSNSGNGLNSSNASGKGSNSGSSAGSGSGSGSSNGSSSGGGGFLGHLLNSVGQAVQQVGQQLVGLPVTTGQPANGSVPPGIAQAGQPSGGGLSTSSGQTTPGTITINTFDGALLHTAYAADSADPTGGPNALAWLQKNDPDGRYPVRIVQDVRAASGGGNSGYRTVSGTYAFCGSDHTLDSGFEPLMCRVRANGDLYVRVAGGISTHHEVPDGYGKLGPELINPTSFTVPRGDYSRAYTNLNGSHPHFYRNEATSSFQNTRGFEFSTSFLRSVPHIAAVIGGHGTCPAGVVVHTRNGVPILFQQETSGNMPFGWVPLGSGKTIYNQLSSGLKAQSARQQSRVEACEEVADVPSARASLPTTPVLLGVRDNLEVNRGGVWVTDPAAMHVVASGTLSNGVTLPYHLTYPGLPRRYAPWADLVADQAVMDLHTNGFGTVTIRAGRYIPGH
ncbi:MAG: hypothetical protein ACYCS8_08240 [Acidithiobacillus sp.]